MTQPLISVAGLGKTYRVYGHPWDRLREMATGRARHRAFEALRDISFELHAGESLGIIGENGAGKSTLLKVLSGVCSPTRGEVAVRGQVASLLELGMGFHPEFTGRQNIRVNAAMMGLSEEEVDHKTPEIIAFSELGEFIDRPVKTYSTGMAMRLGFAIAVQVEPEILIIDEALSVGDGYFQKKCMDRLQELVASGLTLLFCSHAMYYVSAFCRRAVWLREGRMESLGRVDEVVRGYENFLLTKSESRAGSVPPEDGLAQPARITEVRLVGGEAYRPREPWILELEWETADLELTFHVGVGIDRIDGVQICSFGTHRDDLPPLRGEARYKIRLLVPELPMLKGDFTLYVFLLDETGLHVYDQELIHSAFTVETRDYHVGLIQAEHSWDLECRAAGARPSRGATDPR